MVKMSKNKKSVLILFIAALFTLTFAGCQSKNSSAASSSNNTTSSSKKNRSFNSTQMKQKMQNSLKTLVSKGTITQAQADKILTALTANTQRFGNRNNQQSSQQNGQSGNNQGNYNKARTNPLDSLVKDGTITQAQADAVMQQIRGNYQHTGRNGNNNNSNNNSGNNGA